MARPALTEYLLKLATDPDELLNFRKSKDEARRRMESAGLSAEQCAAVLSRDAGRLKKAISDETADILPNIFAGQIKSFLTKFEDE